MALKSGFNDFTNSMAAAMQEAFRQAWPEYMDDQPAPDPNPQMQLMFVAIARGVVKHLAEHPEAFNIAVNSSGNHRHTAPAGGGGNTSTNGAHTHTIDFTIKGDEFNI